MPWETPNLRSVRQLVRDSVRSNLPGADALIPNSVLRVLSDNQGALCHLTLQYLDWLSLQLLPDTAETEWLDRHGNIWLVNSDGTTGRKLATPASGIASVTGLENAVLPQGTLLTSGFQQGMTFETVDRVFLGAVGMPTQVRIRALDSGTIGNLPLGSGLNVAPTPNVNPTAVVISLEGGTDPETDDQLRYRILRRIRQPPMGGCAYDYENWALAVPGVTRAWCVPNQMGIGTVVLRFLCDDLRADDDGWPTAADIERLATYIDRMRPVAVKDCFILAPIKQFIDVTIKGLRPDNLSVRAEVVRSLRRMIYERGSPGQTIFSAWKTHAIMSAAQVDSCSLVDDEDVVMLSPAHMPVLGTVSFQT